MLRRLRKGQSTAEYAIVIGLVIAAAVGMQIYVKRSIQGKIKDATSITNDAGGGVTIGNTVQYEPDYATTENMESKRDAKERATTVAGGGLTRVIDGEDVSIRTGTTRISAVQ
ncbi:MAG: hypothetical protein Q8N80_06275 [Candidatus Omnitrophota bacterium]|nr:hypothetical protein [Candidatus Omnitrophota bacterium]